MGKKVLIILTDGVTRNTAHELFSLLISVEFDVKMYNLSSLDDIRFSCPQWRHAANTLLNIAKTWEPDISIFIGPLSHAHAIVFQDRKAWSHCIAFKTSPFRKSLFYKFAMRKICKSFEFLCVSDPGEAHFLEKHNISAYFVGSPISEFCSEGGSISSLIKEQNLRDSLVFLVDPGTSPPSLRSLLWETALKISKDYYEYDIFWIEKISFLKPDKSSFRLHTNLHVIHVPDLWHYSCKRLCKYHISSL